MTIQFRLFRFVLTATFFLFFIPTVFAQSSIRGVLRTAAGAPLAGGSIAVRGSTQAAVSNEKGEFTVNASPGDILRATYIGYEAAEMRLGNETTISFVLHPANASMDEVVVIGYGTTTRKDLTGAVAKVDVKKIPTSANSSVPELLFGRAPGLQVQQQSSQPGGAINLSVRGKGTPLIVVDGVIYPASALEPDNGSVELQGVNRGMLAGLNPGDIESIEVLKDASASIYGVSAANGVILVTTKKGKSGRMNITYDGSRSLVKNMPYLEPLNATDYMNYYNQLNIDKWLSDRNMAPFGNVAPDLAGYTQKFTDAEVQSAGVGTDWLGQVMRNGTTDNHSLSINGGSEKLVYYFSGSIFNQVGTVKGSDLLRYTGRMNMSFEMNRFLRLNAAVSVNRNDYSNPQAGWQTGGAGTQGFNALQAALAYPSYLPVRDADGKYTQFAFVGNPVSLLDIKDKTEFQGVLANLSLDATIIPEMLTAKLMYGNNYEYSVRDFYIPSTVFWGQIYRARANLSEARRQNQTMEASVNFKRSFGNWLKLDVVAGVGKYPEKWAGMSIEAFDVPDAINTDDVGQATGPKTVGSYRGGAEYRSFFSRANIDVLDRYLVSLIFRRDGADRFFPENKYENFPGVSIGWKLSNESFLKNATVLNLLKLRASYGHTGARPGDLAYGIFSPDAAAVTFNNGSTVYIPYVLTQFNNPDFQWPVTKTLNLGLDFGVMKDRISGTVDVFRENMTRMNTRGTTDQLSFIPTTPINGGHQLRTGYEVGLNTTNIQGKDFTWNTYANLTHYTNRWIERFPNDPLPHGGRIEDGIGSIYVYNTNGILQTGQAVPEWQPAGALKPGSPIFVDKNGDKTLDDQDIVRYDGIPKAIIGLGNNFTYKNFDLSVFFYGQFGAWGYDYTSLWGDPLSLLSNMQSVTTRVKDAWSVANPSGTLPGAAYNETTVTGLNAGIDTRLAKRDFFRCRNITLGYSFNSTGISKYVRNLRVYADVQNAFIITDFEGADPEVQAASIKGGPAPYPMARTFSLGVKAAF